MSEMINKQYRLAQRPVGAPNDQTWSFHQEPAAQPGEGELLIKLKYISLDPAMRGWLNDVKSYIPPVGINEVMRACSIGEVIDSKNPDFTPGDIVVGVQGVQQYALSDGKGLHKVDPSAAPLPRYLGVLGMPGMTAYFGLLEVGQPKEGETVLVSGAAGAVGSVVGQIAKIKGCRVVGIAGGADKCQLLKDEFSYDGVIDYKNEDLKAALKRECPNGVDVFFDNVGGDILDTVLTHINMKARIVICGAISQYNNASSVKGPSNYLSLLVNRARMEGLVVFDYTAQYGMAAREMAGWIAEGTLNAREHIVEGIEKFPEALMMLFTGENFGKLVLKVEE